jgi:hypothetical protein
MKIIAATALFLFAFSAEAANTHACAQRTAASFPTYVQAPGFDPRPAPDPNESKSNSTARGDYDGDGNADTALLLRPKSGSGKYAISVCLSSRPNSQPELIRNAYTSGALATIPKGQQYYDFNTGAEGAYERDGVGTSCCECCGATYIFRKGRFVEIVDSD